MQPGGSAKPFEAVKNRFEARMVERRAEHVRVDLRTQRVKLVHRSVDLQERGIRVLERQRRRKSDEAVRIPLHQVRHLVVGEPSKFRRDLRRTGLLDGRHRQHEYLRVVAKGLQPAPARVEVGQRGIEIEDPLSVVAELPARHRALQVSLDPLAVMARKDVGERIDLAHRIRMIRTIEIPFR